MSRKPIPYYIDAAIRNEVRSYAPIVRLLLVLAFVAGLMVGVLLSFGLQAL